MAALEGAFTATSTLEGLARLVASGAYGLGAYGAGVYGVGVQAATAEASASTTSIQLERV